MVLKVEVPERLINGDVDEGLGSVADVFRSNFTERHAGFRLYDDPREIALRDAVYRSLGARPQLQD